MPSACVWKHARWLIRPSSRCWPTIGSKRGIAQRSLVTEAQQSAPGSTEDRESSDSTGPRKAQNDHRKRKVIFSGIQPTGVPHLGNYLGAIQPWVKLQNEARPRDKLFFMIADMHSLTSRALSPDERRQARQQTLAVLLAAGLDPQRCSIFFQSSMKSHGELYWILSCEAGMGWLSRIPTWREKLHLELGRAGDDNVNMDISSLLQSSPNPKSQERLKLGLFSYPVLQAADILLYQATHVPVGADQVHNLEFARGMANTFNAAYGAGGAIDPKTRLKVKGRPILTPPEPIISKAKRVMSLTEPNKKMSKSAANPRGRILITDEEEEIRKKFQAAVTDSLDEGITYDPERRPGVSNLLEIVSHIGEAEGDLRQPSEIATEFKDLNVQGSVLRVLKERAAELVIGHLRPVRERYEELMNGSDKSRGILSDAASDGWRKASAAAGPTMDFVRRAIGLKLDLPKWQKRE